MSQKNRDEEAAIMQEAKDVLFGVAVFFVAVPVLIYLAWHWLK